MKKGIYLLPFLLLFIFSCKTGKKKTIDIKGDWVSQAFEGNWGNKIISFSFQDSTCAVIHPFGDFWKYTIEQDTLTVQQRIGKGPYKKKEKYRFQLETVDADHINLIPLDESTKTVIQGFKQKEWESKIPLSKVREKSTYSFDRIGFFSTICFGTCPSMYFEMDNKGNFLLQGRAFLQTEGYFKGKVSPSNRKVIQQKVNAIAWDSLAPSYAAGWTDDQTIGVKIKVGDQSFESKAYGFDKEPIELRLLFHYLIELYKEVPLTADSTVFRQFQFEEFQFSGYPPPPPIEDQEEE